MTPADLRLALADPDLEPREISAYRTDLQMKIAAPLACLLLPLIALFFAATGPPFPRPVHTLIACASSPSPTPSRPASRARWATAGRWTRCSRAGGRQCSSEPWRRAGLRLRRKLSRSG